MPLRVTLDTGVLPADDLLAVAGDDVEFAVVSVSQRELEGTPWHVHLSGLNTILETGVWDESSWDEFAWAEDADPLERVLAVISSNSFPKPELRATLKKGQQNQLRDAMIFAAHIREARDIFVTTDGRAFVNEGRRDRLQDEFSTRIMTSAELRELLVARRSGAV